MGGPGSGWRWRSGRELTSSRRRLDVRQLARGGHLERHGEPLPWGWTDGGTVVLTAEPDGVRLAYRYRGAGVGGEAEPWREVVEVLPLDWTPCNYGGRRPWWRCPGCGRRVAILYGGALFRCRGCARLAYPSQNENEADRALRRVEKIRQRMGGTAGWGSRLPPRPKGMHRRTYERLWWKADAADWAVLRHLAARLGLELGSMMQDEPTAAGGAE